MPVPLRIRRAGQFGIITDGDARDLPINAFSAGSNIRFDGRSVRRAPVFRLVDDNLSTFDPVFVFSVRRPGVVDQIIYTDPEGSIFLRDGAVHTDVTPAAHVPAITTAPTTGGILGTVIYVNRGSEVPYHKTPAATDFAVLPGWDASWRTAALRPFLSFLIAMNVQKGANVYPGMVKWSHRALTGEPPDSWDETDTTRLAGENQDVGSKTALVDGLALGNTFVLYTEDEIFLMPYVGGQRIFDFRRVTEDGGMINANCAVEVDGKHFVFGPRDIYVFNGVEKHSLVKGRVAEYIFGHLVLDLKHKFFVFHNSALNEIWFCYNTNIAVNGWREVDYCNQAAVYNYVADTWSFMDLPNVSSMALADVETTLITYNTTTLAYETAGGSYASLQNAVRGHVVAVGCSHTGELTGGKLWGVEPISGNLSLLPYTVDPETFKPAYVERLGLGDISQDLPGLEAYKRWFAMYPSIDLYQYGVVFRIGAQKSINADVSWGGAKNFTTASTKYRIHGRYGGRYLAYRMETKEGEFGDFSFSGADMDIRVTEGR